MASVAHDNVPGNNQVAESAKTGFSSLWQRWSARGLPGWNRGPGVVGVAAIWGCVLLIAVLSPALLDRLRSRVDLLEEGTSTGWIFDNDVLKILLGTSVAFNIVASLFCLGRGFCRRHLALAALFLLHGVLYCAARSMEISYHYRLERETNIGHRNRLERETNDIMAQRPTSPIDLAAEVVNADAQSWGDTCGLAPEYRYALSAMDYVQNTLSTGRFRLLSRTRQLPDPLNAERCLLLRAGSCGNHVETFDKVLSRCEFSVKRRGVEFFLHDETNGNNSSHVAAEVYYKGGWRFFDVICGTFFVRRGATTQDDLLSVTEIRDLIACGEPWQDLAVVNAGAVWRRQNLEINHDPYWALTWSETDVLLGHTGTIRLRADASKTRYSLESMPTAVGHLEGYCGILGEIQFRLDGAVLRAGRQGTLCVRVKHVNRAEGNLVVKSPTQVLANMPLRDIKPDQEIRIDVRQITDDLTVQIDSGAGCAELREIFMR